MTKRVTFTQAELERAIRAADKAGRGVEVIHGVIRIVAQPIEATVASSQTVEECDDQNEIDQRFECGT